MNQKTHYTLSFYHLSLAIRDTIEYIHRRPSYPYNVWLAKKNTIEMSLKENSPFINFCNNNGEIGEKMKEQLQDLYDTVYGEDQTFVSIEGEEVKPDAAQNLKVLDYVIPLKQSLLNILRAYMNNQKTDGSLCEGVQELVELEDKLYRSIFAMVISDYLFNNLFAEFNKAMKENNGQPSIQSNFVTNDIKKVIGMIQFVNKNALESDTDFKDAFNDLDLGIKLISGIEKVPAGSSFPQEFQKIVQRWYQNVAKLEPAWRVQHTKIWNELVEFERELNSKSQH